MSHPSPVSEAVVAAGPRVRTARLASEMGLLSGFSAAPPSGFSDAVERGAGPVLSPDPPSSPGELCPGPAPPRPPGPAHASVSLPAPDVGDLGRGNERWSLDT